MVIAIVLMFGFTCNAGEDWQKKAKETEVQLIQAQLKNIEYELALIQQRARVLVDQRNVLQTQLKQKQDALNPKTKDKK